MLVRHPKNPIISPADVSSDHSILQDVSSVFNPGAISFQGKHYLVTRVQSRSRETFFMVAESDNGIEFDIRKSPIHLDLPDGTLTPYHAYDPRLTVIDGRCYMMYAADMQGLCTLGLAVTDDFEQFEFLGYTTGTYPDTRNGVLFPEKIDGQYLRLERPNIPQKPGNPTSGETITISSSKDLLHWEHTNNIISGRPHFWDERIGAGPPPIKTKHGWLLIYHGVATHFASSNIYQAGAILLDLTNPTKVLARTRLNILEPREIYETVGQVANVVFPSGCIPSQIEENGTVPDDVELMIYYGAADTSIGLATATVGDIIHACHEPAGEPGEMK